MMIVAYPIDSNLWLKSILQNNLFYITDEVKNETRFGPKINYFEELTLAIYVIMSFNDSNIITENWKNM